MSSTQPLHRPATGKNKTDLFADKVLVHLTESGVGASVDRPAVDVVAVEVGHKDEHADVGQGAEVDELLDLMLEEPLVDQRYEDPLHKRCNHRTKQTCCKSVPISASQPPAMHQ